MKHILSRIFNRHWLVWLEKNTPVSNISDEVFRKDIAAWIDLGKPFVLARFNPEKPELFNLGFSMPNGEGKPLRASFSVKRSDIVRFAPPPALQVPELLNEIKAAELETPRVFGSLLWQYVSGKNFLRKSSDMDIVMNVETFSDCEKAEKIFREYENKNGITADCEFLLPDGAFVNMKEFFTPSDKLLVKRLNSVYLADKSRIRKMLSLNSPPQKDLPEKAVEALFLELLTYPKPGLVSIYDEGSHSDMNACDFVTSIRSLQGYFSVIAEMGIEKRPFAALKTAGMEAEKNMLEAASGINTHRGAIFSLGLLCAAAACAFLENPGAGAEDVRRCLMKNWGKDLLSHHSEKETHGNTVEKRYGIRGVRQEAAEGFPSVFETGLPVFRKCMKETGDFNAALIHAFFEILLKTDDSNILYRGGVEALEFSREKARAFLGKGGVFNKDWFIEAALIHREFIKRNLSPGGVADILSCVIFIDSVTDRACNRNLS